MILLSRPMLCLLSLLLLAPGVGFAAAPLETPSALRWQESPEELESEPVRPSRPHGVFRVTAELGVGALASVGLGIVGARIGVSRCPPSMLDVPDGCTLYPLTGLWLGSGLGFALGVWGGGTLLGGQGHILHTLGGMALGMAAGAGAFALSRGTITAFSGAALLLPYALSVVAFEVSSSVRLQPLVSVSPRGGTVLGLAGSF
ncbi:hypothetical protein NR798_24505 [Archangium gephyra]|uniref:hypothetical protein n=1 Tax=Archangium gephyra TaxID=48 RepID=UPI0035D407BA